MSEEIEGQVNTIGVWKDIAFRVDKPGKGHAQFPELDFDTYWTYRAKLEVIVKELDIPPNKFKALAPCILDTARRFRKLAHSEKNQAEFIAASSMGTLRECLYVRYRKKCIEKLAEDFNMSEAHVKGRLKRLRRKYKHRFSNQIHCKPYWGKNCYKKLVEEFVKGVFWLPVHQSVEEAYDKVMFNKIVKNLSRKYRQDVNEIHAKLLAYYGGDYADIIMNQPKKVFDKNIEAMAVKYGWVKRDVRRFEKTDSMYATASAVKKAFKKLQETDTDFARATQFNFEPRYRRPQA